MKHPIKTLTLSGAALCATLLSVPEAWAHALWIEPAEGGYKVCYGEPGEGLRENKAKLEELGPLKAWDAAGKEVKATLKDDHYFVATTSASLKASAVEAPLYGEGEHAGRPFWHAGYLADAGRKAAPSKGASLEILPDGTDGLSFKLLKAGKPLSGEKVTMLAPGGWSKSFRTDAEGKMRIETPWPGRYVLEAGVEEKAPGKFKDKPHASVYNAYTLAFARK